MINSMTAFGRGLSRSPAADVTAEIRSVNNRYLDMAVKLPRSFSYLEDKIKSYISDRGVFRGKVEIYIGIELASQSSCAHLALDTEYARAYIDALRFMAREFSLTDDISVMRVAENRDIFRTERTERDPEEDWQLVLPALSDACDMFLAARAAEGERIERDLRAKAAYITSLTPEIERMSGEDVKSRQAKLEDRIKKLLGDYGVVPDETRLLTECALFADKIAVDEELVRLASHFKALDEILSSDGQAGRRLDFLLQEMNRETNTIGSKCSNLAITKIVVQIKSELEKIREQIQNIE